MSYYPRPIVFMKSYQQRLDDFNKMLGSLKTSEIKKEWSNYVELTIEPVGWQAIWKLSRDLCDSWKVHFPCTAIVTVNLLNHIDLTCCVSVSKVDDDNIHLPEEAIDVPLIELYPTMEQDSFCAFALYDTSQLIDSLRFFYHHLWMPWDLDSDDSYSWVEAHLEGRLQLHFAIVERRVPYKVAYTVRELAAESVKVKKSIEDLEDAMAEMESADMVLRLANLHIQLSNIKETYSIYEKPCLLRALVKRDLAEEVRLDPQSTVCLVLSSAHPEQFQQLGQFFSGQKEIRNMRVCSSLVEALVNVPATGRVFVTAGEHPVLDLASLDAGGSITGVEPGVILKDSVLGCSRLDLLQGSLALSALHIRLNCWNAIKMAQNVECHLSEVRLEGSAVTDGIYVSPGAKLVATDCHFTNCRMAITCEALSAVTLTNCTFTGNNTALEVHEGCNLSMENCTITGSKMWGVVLFLSTEVHNKNKISINSIPNMKEMGTTYKDNKSDLKCIVRTEPTNYDGEELEEASDISH